METVDLPVLEQINERGLCNEAQRGTSLYDGCDCREKAINLRNFAREDKIEGPEAARSESAATDAVHSLGKPSRKSCIQQQGMLRCIC